MTVRFMPRTLFSRGMGGGGVQAQFRTFVGRELAENTLDAQDAILQRYGGNTGTVPLNHKLGTS